MSSTTSISQKLLDELLIRTAGSQCLSSGSKHSMSQETEDEREKKISQWRLKR